MVLNSLSVACLYKKSIFKPVSQVQSFPYNRETKNIHREFTFARKDMYFHKKYKQLNTQYEDSGQSLLLEYNHLYFSKSSWPSLFVLYCVVVVV